MSVTTSVDQVLETAVARGDVPGAVALAADDRGVIYEGACGRRGADSPAPMATDTVFWIASMTKLVTSVAALQLVERGALRLDEPLGDRLPELAAIRVLEGFADDGTPRLRAPHRPITLRHLLSHTAGFTYNIWNADMRRYQEYAGIPSIGECKTLTLQTPLVFDPGERWEYGINIDWVGKAVERVSGQSLEAYFRTHIFDPLGMADTGFLLRPDQRTRLAGMHARQPGGALQPIPFEMPQQPEFFMGGAGLYSTGADYLTFLRMLLGGGQFNDARVLRPKTVAELATNQIGDLPAGDLTSADPASSNDLHLLPGVRKAWGLGSLLTLDDAPTGRAAGSLAWAGLANTYFWIDPTRRITGLVLTQILPFADPIVLDLFTDFERTSYASYSG